MYAEDLIRRRPALLESREDIEAAFGLLKDCYNNNNKVLLAGNGGSMADSQHIAGELMKRFVAKRGLDAGFVQELSLYGADGEYLAGKLQGALPAIALDASPLTSAIINDSGTADIAFAQMVCGLGKPGDVFWGISTSGNSRNVCLAAVTAQALGMRVLGLTGAGGGKLKGISDVCVCVPETETYKIQELHISVYHTLALMLEDEFFGGTS
jgi:D-sedoheptulose 7-phosphate isomerase